MTPDERLLSELRKYPDDEVSRLLLDHGVSFAPADAPLGLPDPVKRSCYHNAYTIARAEPARFTYYEGVATTWYLDGVEAVEKSLSWATAHAWCVDEARKVVDTTWHARGVEPAAYRGIALPLDVVEPHAYVESHGTFSGLSYDLRGVRCRLGLGQ